MKRLELINRYLKYTAVGLLLAIILLSWLVPAFRNLSEGIRQLFLYILVGLVVGIAYTQIELSKKKRAIRQKNSSEEQLP